MRVALALLPFLVLAAVVVAFRLWWGPAVRRLVLRRREAVRGVLPGRPSITGLAPAYVAPAETRSLVVPLVVVVVGGQVGALALRAALGDLALALASAAALVMLAVMWLRSGRTARFVAFAADGSVWSVERRPGTRPGAVRGRTSLADWHPRPGPRRTLREEIAGEPTAVRVTGFEDQLPAPAPAPGDRDG
ncbi:MAG TPA: hypothetical protein VF743_11375 [Acidimicrobiales bacterium]